VVPLWAAGRVPKGTRSLPMARRGRRRAPPTAYRSLAWLADHDHSWLRQPPTADGRPGSLVGIIRSERSQASVMPLELAADRLGDGRGASCKAAGYGRRPGAAALLSQPRSCRQRR